MKYLKLWLPIIIILAMVLTSCGAATPTPQPEEPAAEEPAVEEPAAEEPAAEEPAAEEPVAEEPATEEPAPAEKVTIEFWVDDDLGQCFVETIVEPFNAQSDSVTVEAVTFAEVWESERTALAGGAGPDIVDSPGPSFVYELVQAGQLLPLDDLTEEFGWKELFVPWALSLGRVDGKLYSLPDELETLVLYYNKTLFEEKGWEPPTTIDEMNILAKEIADEDIIPFAHSNADWRPANEWYVGEYLNHVAGPQKVYDALTGEVRWTDPDFVEAISLLNEAQQNGWYMGGLEFYYTTLWDDWHVANATGEAAMNIEGTWSASDINTLYFTEETGGNEWDWVPVPSKSGEAIFDIGMGHTFSVNANTENPQAVGEFLTYLYTPEIQAKRFAACGLAPAPVRMPPGTLTGVDPRIGRIFETLSTASDSGNYGYTTWTFFPPKSDVYIYEEIEKVWAGDITPEEYLEGLQAIFEEELAAGEIPPIPER